MVFARNAPPKKYASALLTSVLFLKVKNLDSPAMKRAVEVDWL